VRPKNHRGTESTENCPQITQIYTDPPTHPRKTADHADEHRWVHTGLLCVARSWPPNGGTHRLTSSGETPWPSNDGKGSTGSGICLEIKLSCRFPDPVVCALAERRSRHFFSPSNRREGHAPLPTNTEERQNRRATGTSAGEKWGVDGRSRPEAALFSPATGDHQSPVVLPPRSGTAFQAQRPPLRVGGRAGGLRVFVPSWLRRGWLCVLCDSVVVLSFVAGALF